MLLCYKLIALNSFSIVNMPHILLNNYDTLGNFTQMRYKSKYSTCKP